jgi:hypothetical protein
VNKKTARVGQQDQQQEKGIKTYSKRGASNKPQRKDIMTNSKRQAQRPRGFREEHRPFVRRWTPNCNSRIRIHSQFMGFFA